MKMKLLRQTVSCLAVFAALAGVMYATRNVDWQGAGAGD